MSATDRIQVILDKMREMRQMYSDLKSAVNHIEKKKRRAKRKEKEILGMQDGAMCLWCRVVVCLRCKVSVRNELSKNASTYGTEMRVP